jgi:hypothetical protein
MRRRRRRRKKERKNNEVSSANLVDVRARDAALQPPLGTRAFSIFISKGKLKGFQPFAFQFHFGFY